MYKTVLEGDKWGVITCTYAGVKKVEVVDGPVTITTNAFVYVLECECGNVITVERSQFKGKRLVKDCGCGMGTLGKADPLNVTIPIQLKIAVMERAQKEGMNTSQMVARLLRVGLEQVEGKIVEGERRWA